ncbi:MAG TPA: hypothetical protein VGH53_18705 [Streptosporangiaceae bacterium]|jgi:hypothetical protein
MDASHDGQMRDAANDLGSEVTSERPRFPRTGPELYKRTEGPAEAVKGYLQMLLGLVTAIALLYEYARSWHSQPIATVADRALTLVGAALAVSAVIELAYTFFTQSLDEALDPLILGASSFALIKISESQTKLDVRNMVPLLLLVFAMALLFLVRRYLLETRAEGDRAVAPQASRAGIGDEQQQTDLETMPSEPLPSHEAWLSRPDGQL